MALCYALVLKGAIHPSPEGLGFLASRDKRETRQRPEDGFIPCQTSHDSFNKQKRKSPDPDPNALENRLKRRLIENSLQELEELVLETQQLPANDYLDESHFELDDFSTIDPLI